MSGKNFWMSIVALVFGFAGGFFLANTLNRVEMDTVKAENDRLKTNRDTSSDEAAEFSLTDEETKKKLAEADANPKNFAFQKNLGLALYRYASMKRDVELLSKSMRILVRALALEPNDHDLQVGLGNAYFDIGYFNKDNESFEKSREFYGKALAKRPDDVEIQTDLALTYFLQQPSKLPNAVAEFEKALVIDPNHDKTLQFLIQSLLKQNETDKAANYLEQLKRAHPASPSINELSSLLNGRRETPQQ